MFGTVDEPVAVRKLMSNFIPFKLTEEQLIVPVSNHESEVVFESSFHFHIISQAICNLHDGLLGAINNKVEAHCYICIQV